jgi:hypothetical protein
MRDCWPGRFRICLIVLLLSLSQSDTMQAFAIRAAVLIAWRGAHQKIYVWKSLGSKVNGVIDVIVI